MNNRTDKQSQQQPQQEAVVVAAAPSNVVHLSTAAIFALGIIAIFAVASFVAGALALATVSRSSAHHHRH